MSEKAPSTLPCPSCGSQLRYSPEKDAFHCDHCGHTEAFTATQQRIHEQDFHHMLQQQRHVQPATLQKTVLGCENCGAQLMLDEIDAVTRCNFCGSNKVHAKAFEQNFIQPQAILPFEISKKVASQKFKDWIKKGIFHPGKLKKLARLGDVHGIYVPFWTFDADSDNQWRGQAGFYYYVTESYTDSEGRRQTRQVRKTRWEYRQGHFSHFFDDVLVVASQGLPKSTIEKIYPFNLQALSDFDSRLLSGWETEIYSKALDKGYQEAAQYMREGARQMARRALGGDTQRDLHVQTLLHRETFKHVLLPVWLCTYMYNGKSYQFAVNGQTGKIKGEKPLSWVRVGIAVLLGLLIVAAIVYFSQQAEQA